MISRKMTFDLNILGGIIKYRIDSQCVGMRLFYSKLNSINKLFNYSSSHVM